MVNLKDQGGLRVLNRIRTPKGRTWLKRVLLIAFFLEFAAMLAFLLWKCRYGFGNEDEAFSLTIPFRLVHGDRLLLHESHMSQFAGLTMVPEMWLYLKLAGTTDGIILAFRYIYTVLWSAGALFLYFRARSISDFGARCAALFVQCYAPFGMMNLSYNSLGILYLVNAILFLLCARRCQRLQFTVSGVFFSGAVLCCPYLALVYFAYSMALLAARLTGRRPRIAVSRADALECWKFFSLGVAVSAALVLLIVFWGTSPKMVLDSLRYALGDPDHAVFSPVQKSLAYFRSIAASNAYFWPMLVTVAVMTGLTLYQKRAVWFAVVCAAAILYMRRFLQEEAYLNYLMFPLTFVGIYTLAVSKDRAIRQVGLLWLVPGILYTWCLNYSSNQHFYAISSAATVSSAASLLMMWLYCGELREVYRTRERKEWNGLYRIAYLAVLLTFAFQMRYEIPIRYQSVYWEAGLMKYEEQRELHEGPQKGLIVTVEYADQYARLYPDVKKIDHQKALLLSEECWVWLVNENEFATPSAWFARLTDEKWIRHVKDYYTLHPERKPEIIFLEGTYDHLLSEFDESHYQISRLASGNYLIIPKQTAEPGVAFRPGIFSAGPGSESNDCILKSAVIH